MRQQQQQQDEKKAERRAKRQEKRQAKKEAKQKRGRWHGLLDYESRRMRLATFGLIGIVAVAQTFLQFGFIGVGAMGEYGCYLMALLVPIALAALLLGKMYGALMGLFSGAVLLLHANIQPLDIYERYFVTPLTSVILYTLTGFIFGAFFALAMRGEVTRVRRVIYLAIASFFGSFITSIIFTFSLIIDLITNIAMETLRSAMENGGHGQEIGIPRDTLRALSSTGLGMDQVFYDFLLVLATALVTLAVVRFYAKHRFNMSLLTIFEGRLLVVLIVAFLVVASVAFAVVSRQSEQEAIVSMNSTLYYLADRLDDRENREAEIANVAARYEVSEQDVASIKEGYLLDGFELQKDGTLVVFNDDKVEESDNPAYPVGKTIEEVLGITGERHLEDMAQTGAAHQGIYDVVWHDTSSPAENEDWYGTTQIGYMRAVKAGNRYIMCAYPSSKVFSARSVTMFWTSTLMIVLLVVVYFIAAHLLRVTVLDDIDKTNEALGKITDGNLDTRVDAKDSREFSSLSTGINTTVDALKSWIGEAERRMKQDLTTAKAIQGSALPRTFPPFPEIEEFDIYASMNAAKEVGGDFYDFFLIDEQTLGFLIADVSGKGIPGALFMMAAKTEIENYMSTGMDLAQAILSANRHLCANNDAGMFVTVWAATLNWKTGEVTYVNAGHNPPLLRHDGEWEWLTKRGGLFLGTFDTAKYRSATLTLRPGDQILLYTDGVNEAFNVAEEEYGNDRLEAFLADHADLHPRELVYALRKDVADWATGAEQSDDITMVCLEYGVAPEASGTITTVATIDHLSEVIDLVGNELDQRLCPADVKHKIEVAVEELFVNVCRYAYADQEQPGNVRVSYVYRPDPNSITVEMVDQGVPFNPVTREDPVMPASIADATIGGLGIFMVRNTMDDFTYVYVDNSNTVVFKKAW